MEKFTSAFFFVCHKSPTSLKFVNEKVSASMGFEKHEAVTANFQFELTMYLRSWCLSMCVGLPGRRSFGRA
jgi:hypothetical protein